MIHKKVYLEPKTAKLVEKNAKKEGLSVSSYLRVLLLAGLCK